MIQGLVAATFTPMHPDGSLRFEQIGPLVEHLTGQGLAGLFLCGSTGEGASLTTRERKQVAEAFVRATDGRLPILVHVGHNSLSE
ncbi:MAG TPA: N-acetylneuraminate lyase, partial [Planctomycetes bacterium]|nr:N-acetylneuraminate lyase [Planctomycetota bacterium]